MKNNVPLAAGVLVLATALPFTLGCSSTPTPDGGGNDNGSSPVSFANDIQPLLTNQCIICHQPGGIAFIDGINQDLLAGNAYDAIINQPSDQDPSLTIVIPGNAENSLLFQKINSDTPGVGVRMPQELPPLTTTQIDLIRRWIDEGALDN